MLRGQQTGVSINESGRLVKNGQAYVPSGFSADYRTRWDDWGRLLDSMQAQYQDPVVRFNLGLEARGPGLVLHADVKPGQINERSAQNLMRLVKMFREHNVSYWLVWMHRGGAGTTVPLMWNDRWDEIELLWNQSPWSVAQGGPLQHPRQAFDANYDTCWQASLNWIMDSLGHDPLFVQFELIAEGYLTDAFKDDAQGFLAWQGRMVNYIKSHRNYSGTILSTGDGTSMVRGRIATHAIPESDVFNAHIHPQPNEEKPKITSIINPGSAYAIYNHTKHPALEHVIGKPYWNGAMGYGQYVSRTYSAQDFGRIRTRLDRHAIAEYIFSGNVGTGMPWDHEGHLLTYGAVSKYAPVINFYRDHAIIDNQEIALQPEWVDYTDMVGLYLKAGDRTLCYVFDKSEWSQESPVANQAIIQIPTQWGDTAVSVAFSGSSLFCVYKPVAVVAPEPQPKPKKGLWSWLMGLFR